MDPSLRSCLTQTLPFDFVERIPLTNSDEFRSWIIHEDSRYVALDKPGWIVVHPSKQGPYSSLVGAMKLHTQMSTAYVVGRLDRETSGVTLFTKAAEHVHYTVIQQKVYITILKGEMDLSRGEVVVDVPLTRQPDSLSRVKFCTLNHRHGTTTDGESDDEGEDAESMSSDTTNGDPAEGIAGAAGSAGKVVAKCKRSLTRFLPILVRNGFTICRVYPKTGRLHQIRLHSMAISGGIVGDKMYGCDFSLFNEFAKTGLSDQMWNTLEMPRHALHCESITFEATEVKDETDPERIKAHGDRQQAAYEKKMTARRQRDLEKGLPPNPRAPEDPAPHFIFTRMRSKVQTQHTFVSPLPLDMVIFSHLRMGVSLKELHSLGLLRDPETVRATIDVMLETAKSQS